jgi:hypothetical protein
MTKGIIIVAVVILVALGGWKMFEYWEKVQDDKEVAQQQAAATNVNPDSLPGLPQGWDVSLRAAQQQGPTALGNWLKTYGPRIQDPRKAWIQLDYVLLVTRDNPQEARQIFNEVKDRTPPTSPIWPRIQQFQKSYQ